MYWRMESHTIEKLEFEEEGFNLSSSTLKEFLDVCICLEEAEMQKPLKKKIVCAEREYDKDGNRKHQDKPKSCHERRHSSGKIIKEKERKLFATIMVFVTMAWISVTLCRATGSMFSPHTVSWNSRGSN
eukprot:2188332-Ditylum_brightwellii.AAC.1